MLIKDNRGTHESLIRVLQTHEHKGDFKEVLADQRGCSFKNSFNNIAFAKG